MVPETDAVAATRTLVECMQTEFPGVTILTEADEPAFAGAGAA
jgi:hypothetical protein